MDEYIEKDGLFRTIGRQLYNIGVRKIQLSENFKFEFV